MAFDKRHRDQEAGFTITEVLVTLVVMTIGLAAILGLYGSLAKANVGSERLNRAKAVAEQTMEQLSTLEVAAVEALPAQAPVVHKNTTYQPAVIVEPVAGFPNLARVTIAVTYADEGNAQNVHEMKLQTLRSRLPIL